MKPEIENLIGILARAYAEQCEAKEREVQHAKADWQPAASSLGEPQIAMRQEPPK